jgi:uncharacterized protein with NRDE domain
MLPATGLSLADERALSSAFVVMPERAYGTRSSTLLISSRDNDRAPALMVERTFSEDANAVAQERRVLLENWPRP